MAREPSRSAREDGGTAQAPDAANEPKRLVSGTRPAIRPKEGDTTGRMAPWKAQMLAGPPPVRAQMETVPAPPPEPAADADEALATLASVSRMLVMDLPQPPATVDSAAPTAVPPPMSAPNANADAHANANANANARRRPSLLAAAGLGVLAAAVVCGAVAVAVRARPRLVPPTPATTMRAPEREPPPMAAPLPVPTVAPTADLELTDDHPAIAADKGRIETTDAPPGRRIFVDDHAVAQTPEAVTVKCGLHAIQIGSTGRRQIFDVPCGGTLQMRPR